MLSFSLQPNTLLDTALNEKWWKMPSDYTPIFFAQAYVLKGQGHCVSTAQTVGSNHSPLLIQALMRQKLEAKVIIYKVVYLMWGQRVSESDPGGLLKPAEIVSMAPLLCRYSTSGGSPGIWGSPGISEVYGHSHCIRQTSDSIFHLSTHQPHLPF